MNQGECKFRNAKMPHKEYEDLKNATLVFPYLKEKYLYFVSKSGYEDSVLRHAKEDGATLLGLDDLFV
ncbi:MAG: hypothetical protein IKH28_03955 [Lachnospiraceae bacterium]|nr:hypothetical protein [Lachnospiraceae bacterium]